MSDEFTGRYHDAWVSKRFTLPLRQIKNESVLVIHGRRLPYPEHLTISVYVNGSLVHEEINPGGQFTIAVTIPPMERGNLEIIASDVFVPKEKGINEDVRKLSFLLDELVVPGLPDLMEPYAHLFGFQPSKPVYFLEEEVWDRLCWLLPDHYKIPDTDMLRPMQNGEWWEKRQPSPGAAIRGTVYDKFTSQSLAQAVVELWDKEKKRVMEMAVDEEQQYRFQGVEPGEYTVVGKASGYGEQAIPVRLEGYEKLIHIPMLPLF